MFRGLSYPMKALKGHSSVFNGLEWVLAFVLTRTGDLTAGRIPMAGTGNVLGDSHFEDATTGNFKLAKTGAWTANRTRAMVDADGTEMTLEAAQTVSGVKTFSNGVVMALGSAAAPSIGATGGTTTGLFFTTTSVGISISGAEHWKVDSSGRLIGGGGVSRTVGSVAGARIQIEGLSAGMSAMTVTRHSADVNPARTVGCKTRDTALGGTAIVQNGDQIYSIQAAAGDGTNLTTIVGEDRWEVDGTPGVGVVPGRRRSLTGTTGGTLLEFMRGDSGQGVQMRSSYSATSPGSGQLLARGFQTDEQTVSTTGSIAALASDTGVVRLTGAAPSIQGITAPTLGDRQLMLYCVNAVTLKHEDAAASAANRITSDTAADIAVTAGKTVALVYDATSTRWRPVRF